MLASEATFSHGTSQQCMGRDPVDWVVKESWQYWGPDDLRLDFLVEQLVIVLLMNWSRHWGCTCYESRP